MPLTLTKDGEVDQHELERMFYEIDELGVDRRDAITAFLNNHANKELLDTITNFENENYSLEETCSELRGAVEDLEESLSETQYSLDEKVTEIKELEALNREIQNKLDVYEG